MVTSHWYIKVTLLSQCQASCGFFCDTYMDQGYRTIALWYPKWIGSLKYTKVSDFESCANNCENGGVSVEIMMLMLRCSLCSCITAKNDGLF